MVVEDSIIKRVDRSVCRKYRDRRTVLYVVYRRLRSTHCGSVDRLLGGPGKDEPVMVQMTKLWEGGVS